MKPVFDWKVANDLGYQKYTPEWKDWAFGVFIGIAVLVILTLLIVAPIIGMIHSV